MSLWASSAMFVVSMPKSISLKGLPWSKRGALTCRKACSQAGSKQAGRAVSQRNHTHTHAGAILQLALTREPSRKAVKNTLKAS